MQKDGYLFNTPMNNLGETNENNFYFVDTLRDIEAPKTTTSCQTLPQVHTLYSSSKRSPSQIEPPAEPYPMGTIPLGKRISWDELGEIDLRDSNDAIVVL
jgi:hypothetical protein